MKKVISIITDWNEHLGTGHIQRMSNLLVYLNQQDNIEAYIINKKIPTFIHPEHSDYFCSSIINNSDLIIRDMRDSKIHEIDKLKKFSKVMVIDDLGEGRDYADYKIDLLPSPGTRKYKKEFFIYGYNFTQSLQNSNLKSNTKDIDLAVYAGSTSEKMLDQLLKAMPKKFKIAVPGIKNSYILHNYEKKTINVPYLQILLSSKYLIAHFGISLFEAYLTGCKLITLNPTIYHSDLADLIKDEMNVINLGLWENFIDYNLIIDEINNFQNIKEIKLPEIENTVNKNLHNFYNFILKLIT